MQPCDTHIQLRKPRLAASGLQLTRPSTHPQQPEGLVDVFENFPKYFASGFGGKGHEVGPTHS